MEQAKEFNLLDEPWIRVKYTDCREETVSLIQLFQRAHEYENLAGVVPTLDVVILRLLLAILYSVFTRSDESGEYAPLERKKDGYERWGNIWANGSFPEKPIVDYLEEWRERFWLFHPERPFCQTPEAAIGRSYPVVSFNGEILKSENKERIFSPIKGEDSLRLSYAEATGWLLHLNGYDIKGGRPGKNQVPVGGICWVGQLGFVMAQGENLFETLMLNLVLDAEESRPIWEEDLPYAGQTRKIPLPDNQAELLTLQSRRLLLEREGGFVTGCKRVGGDYFDGKNALVEQMTLWKRSKDEYYPRENDRQYKMWQDFGAFATFSADERGTAPGIVLWHNKLASKGKLTSEIISYRMVGAEFEKPHGSKLENVFEDSLSFHLNLLTELGGTWVKRITDEVSVCEKLAAYVGNLAANLEKAAGGKGQTSADRAKETFFFRVDIPFRKWLRTLDADQSDTERIERLTAWRQQAVQIAERLGKELIRQAGPSAYQGRLVKESKDDPGKWISAPEAYNRFQRNLKDIKKGGQ